MDLSEKYFSDKHILKLAMFTGGNPYSKAWGWSSPQVGFAGDNGEVETVRVLKEESEDMCNC